MQAPMLCVAPRAVMAALQLAEVAAQVEECRFLEELDASLSKDTRDV